MSTIERLKPSEPRPPVTPQTALRVAVLGSIALVMFGIIFFRLWYLQVLSGEQYVQQAKVNDQRVLPIPAPRGQILDRSGKAIVTSRVTNAVQLLPDALPAAVRKQAADYQESLAEASAEFALARERLKAFESDISNSKRKLPKVQRTELHELRHQAHHIRSVPIPPLPRSAVQVRSLFKRLSPLLKLSPRLIDERVIAGITQLPYAPVTIKTDAGPGALTVLAERHNEFPGVRQEPVSIRRYPYGEMAAQVLGYVGQVSSPELKMPAFRGVQQGTVVGQEGVEYYYDRYLRGRPGAQRVQVNSLGQAEPTRLPVTQPIAGHSLKLSLDLGLQQESEKALREGIDRARAEGKPAVAGAFTALDPRNGQVLAMGSFPSFNPNIFAKPLNNHQYEALVGNETGGGPLTNRATEGAYPTGSTFKPITAMAALERGFITPTEGLGAGRCISVSTQQFCNAGHAEYGAIGLVEALKVSSDTYFFEVGERANKYGSIIQKLAHRLGLGQPTHIDLPKEFQGVVPDRAWREARNKLELECRRRTHVSSCGYVAEVRPWSVGDNMQLAVGQGDLLTDPLQMAVVYSTLADAYTHEGLGTVVRPHLGMEIDDSGGGLVQELSSPPVRHVHLNYSDLSLVMEGLHEAASQPGGTSADVWAGWDQAKHPVFGKTGTAQHEGKEDQSWYMCYIGDPSRPIVIAVTVEQGGFGAETAAPIARLMASQWYGQAEKFIAGSSKTQ